MRPTSQILHGNCLDVLKTLPAESVHCCVTSPPYYSLRDYGVDGQIGLEANFEEYKCALIRVFSELWRVLRDDGTVWLNLGDSYAGSGKGGQSETKRSANWQPNYPKIGESSRVNAKTKCAGENRTSDNFRAKNLMMVPHRIAIALQDCGWNVRQEIIWHKLNPMPESVRDRFTNAHEYIFLLTKSPKYFFDAEAVKEPCSDKTNLRVSKNELKPNRQPREGVDVRGGNQGTGGIPIVSPKTILGDLQLKVKNCSSFASSTKFPVATRNKRSVWSTSSEPNSEAHFATFPEKLIEPCVLAGTSERGACAECSAPYVRIVEKESDWQERKANGATAGNVGSSEIYQNGVHGANNTHHQLGTLSSETIGWRKSCDCETDEVKPCVVLDIFNGSGTTGRVALKFKRSYIGIELNPEYVEMSRKRLSDIQVKLF